MESRTNRSRRKLSMSTLFASKTWFFLPLMTTTNSIAFVSGEKNLCRSMPDWMCYDGQFIAVPDETAIWLTEECPGMVGEEALQLLALARFFFSTGNTFHQGSLHEGGWLTSCDPCAGWEGIICQDGKITKLSLASQSPPMIGTLPGYLRYLTDLRTFGLHEGQILVTKTNSSFLSLSLFGFFVVVHML